MAERKRRRSLLCRSKERALTSLPWLARIFATFALASAVAWANAVWCNVHAQPAQPEHRAGKNTPLRAINIGFPRHALAAWATKIADGSFDIATGRTNRWLAHDVDSTLAEALASGRLDIALLGSGVAALAIARGLDLKVIYVAGRSAHSEALALAARIDFNPTDLKSLHGKVVAVPFGSTPHFRLLESLQRWNANMSAMRIVNLQAQQIAGAWERGEIDAVAASLPLLGNLQPAGNIQQLAGLSETTGTLVLAAASEFVSQHLVFLSRLIDMMARSNEEARASHAAIGPDSPMANKAAAATGLTAAEIADGIARYHAPSLAEQVSPAWLGGGLGSEMMAHLKAAVEVWRWGGRLSGGERELGAAVAVEPAVMALGYRR